MPRHDGYECREVQLRRGLHSNGTWHTLCVIREGAVSDLVDGEEAAKGSGTRFQAEVMARQVVSIGDIQGPLPLSLFKKLSNHDMGLISLVLERMEEDLKLEADRIRKELWPKGEPTDPKGDAAPGA